MRPGNSIAFRQARKNRNWVGRWIRPTSKKLCRFVQVLKRKAILASLGSSLLHLPTNQRGNPKRIAIRNFRRQRTFTPAIIAPGDILEMRVPKSISTPSRHCTSRSRSSAKARARQSSRRSGLRPGGSGPPAKGPQIRIECRSVDVLQNQETRKHIGATMSEVRLVVRESDRDWSGTVHGSLADCAIAALSADPVTAGGIGNRLRPLREAESGSPVVRAIFRADCAMTRMMPELVVIDLVARMVMVGFHLFVAGFDRRGLLSR